VSEVVKYVYPELEVHHRSLFKDFECAYRCWISRKLWVLPVKVTGIISDLNMFDEFVLRFLHVGETDTARIARRMGLEGKLIYEILTHLESRGYVDHDLLVTERGRAWLEGREEQEEVAFEGVAFSTGKGVVGVMADSEWRREVEDDLNIGTEGRRVYVRFRDDSELVKPGPAGTLDLLRAYRAMVYGLKYRVEDDDVGLPKAMEARVRVSGEWRQEEVVIPVCLTLDGVVAGDPVFGRFCEQTGKGISDGLAVFLEREVAKHRGKQKERPLKFRGIGVAVLGDTGRDLAQADDAFSGVSCKKTGFYGYGK